jgi:hypothetical protein
MLQRRLLGAARRGEVAFVAQALEADPAPELIERGIALANPNDVATVSRVWTAAMAATSSRASVSPSA